MREPALHCESALLSASGGGLGFPPLAATPGSSIMNPPPPQHPMDPFYASPFSSPFYRRHTPYMGQPDFRVYELNKRLQQRPEVSQVFEAFSLEKQGEGYLNYLFSSNVCALISAFKRYERPGAKRALRSQHNNVLILKKCVKGQCAYYINYTRKKFFDRDIFDD